MHKFVRAIITEWRKLGLPTKDATLVAGVSGGADSVSLLLALVELRRRSKLDLHLVAAHFNHGLRAKQSDADEAFVRDLAQELDVKFVAGKGKVRKTGNLEENAREARYGFLGRTARDEKAFAVATGHTINDQAETFVMNLLRGSGPDGLSAMPAVRPLTRAENGQKAQILLVRPLLAWATRDDTEAFCRSLGVKYRSDAMNDDSSFTRVRIRKELMPMLRTFNPKIVSTLAGTAQLIGGTVQGTPAMDPQMETLSLSQLRLLGTTDRRVVLRSWLGSRRGNLRALGLKHIEAIDRLIGSKKSGNTVEIPGSGRVIKRGGRLRFEK